MEHTSLHLTELNNNLLPTDGLLSVMETTEFYALKVDHSIQSSDLV